MVIPSPYPVNSCFPSSEYFLRKLLVEGDGEVAPAGGGGGGVDVPLDVDEVVVALPVETVRSTDSASSFISNGAGLPPAPGLPLPLG